MKRWWGIVWLLPVALAVVFWWFPPRGDDAYYHSVSAVEQVRAWQEGAVFPGYQRGWNGGTGSFAPTIYAPIPTAIQGGLVWLVGDGQRAVGLSLSLALLAAVALLRLATGRGEAALLVATPYVLATAVTRATTTEAWALAGAAVVLALGMPAHTNTVRRGLGLAAGVILVVGSQVGMMLQVGVLLAVAWLTWRFFPRRHRPTPDPLFLKSGLRMLAWALAGLMTGAVFWLPLLVDGGNLALGELVEGPLDWRQNFLPGSSELSVFFSLTAVCLGLTVFVVLLRGEGDDRIAQAIAASAALFLTVGLSTPLWFLPGMNVLQFPWRFLGPATLLLVMALGSLRGRWLWIAVALLVVPSAAVPLRLDSGGGNVPVTASPVELALIVEEHWGLVPVLPSARGLYAPAFHRLASLQELERQEAAVVVRDRTVWGGTWVVTLQSRADVMMPIQWWPEWRMTVDGEVIPFANRHGLVAIECPAGTSEIRAELLRSPSRVPAVWLSLAGVVFLVFLVRRGGDRGAVRGAL